MNYLRCILVAALIASVLGHGVMIKPVPFNTNPTTQSPCGVAKVPTPPAAAATWGVGTTVSITWSLIAGDGGNSVDGLIDLTGKGTSAGDFKTPVFSGMPIGPSLSQYSYSFVVPSVDCSGSPGGLCLLRMVTNTGWNSCTYVNITNCQNCPTMGPAPPVCTELGNLNFCADQSNLEAYLDANADPTVIDSDARTVFRANLANPNVFLNNGTACSRMYQQYLCGLNFPPCPGSGMAQPISPACRSKCQATMDACQLNTKHALLYNCSDAVPCPGDRNAGSTVAVSVFAVVALIAALVF